MPCWLVHDVVAGLELQRVDDRVRAAPGELARGGGVVADGAAVEVGLGDEREPLVGEFGAGGERRLQQVAHSRLEVGGVVGQRVDGAAGGLVLGEHLHRALDEAGAVRRHRDAPALGEPLPDMLDGGLRIAGEARHRLAVHVQGVALVAAEWRERPPRALAAQLVQLAHREVVAAREVDRRLGAGGCGAPGGVEELAVRLAQVARAARDALGREHGDRRILGEVVDDGHEPADERRRERLHALDGDALGELAEHPRDVRELVLHLPRPGAHGVGEQQLSARGEVDGVDRLVEGALVGDAEGADLVDLVAEEVDAQRVRRFGREHVEDAAAHGELAAPGDHVDALVGELDEPRGDAIEVVAAAAGGEADARGPVEARDERLQGGAHRGEEHERGLVLGLARRIPPLPQRAHRGEPLAGGVGARAEALVWESLPGGEVDDARLREERGEVDGVLLGLAARRGDREHERRMAESGGALLDQPGEQRGAQAVDEGEVGVALGTAEGARERLRLASSGEESVKTHPKSLVGHAPRGRAGWCRRDCRRRCDGRNAAAAIDFYREVLGASVAERYTMGARSSPPGSTATEARATDQASSAESNGTVNWPSFTEETRIIAQNTGRGRAAARRRGRRRRGPRRRSGGGAAVAPHEPARGPVRCHRSVRTSTVGDSRLGARLEA